MCFPENGLSRGLVTARPKNLKFFCGEDTMSNDGSLRLSSGEQFNLRIL